MSPEELAKHILGHLGETEDRPKKQMAAIVEALGPDRCMALLYETRAVEAQGGMLLPDGTRRRTPGGVFFVLARSRLTKEQRKAIFDPWYSNKKAERAPKAPKAEGAPAAKPKAAPAPKAKAPAAPPPPTEVVHRRAPPRGEPPAPPPPPAEPVEEAPAPRRKRVLSPPEPKGSAPAATKSGEKPPADPKGSAVEAPPAKSRAPKKK